MPTYYCKTCDKYVYVSRPVNLVCHECGGNMARDDDEEEEYIMNLEEKWYSK